MNRIIEALQEEHRNLEKVLLVLEQELNVFDRRERPDYEIIKDAIDYLQAYPDRCHHPKEDLIFAKLQERDPVAAATVGDLAAEHEQVSRRLHRVAVAIEGILTDHDLLRQTVDDVVHDFIDREREHIAMEERVLFPAALRVLQPEDWLEIESRLNDKDDPLFSQAVEARFAALRQRVLRWEQDNEVERAEGGPAEHAEPAPLGPR